MKAPLPQKCAVANVSSRTVGIAIFLLCGAISVAAHASTEAKLKSAPKTVEHATTSWYSTIAVLVFNGREAADYVDIAVGDDGRLLIPFEEIIRLGEAEVHRLGESEWEFKVPSLGASLWIDVETKRIRINGEDRTLPVDAIDVVFDTLLIDKQLLEEGFGLAMNYEKLGMLLTVNTTRPWPLDLRLAREMRWRRLGVEAPNGPPAVVYDMPYLAMGAPQINVAASYSDSATGAARHDWRLQGVTEALYLTNRFSLSGDFDQGISSARLTSGRSDPRGNVFGVDSLYEVSIGDVNGFSVPLARGPGNGVGVVLRGTPLTVPDDFDVTVVTGEAPLGWDAELYVAGQLLDFQRIDNTGQYRFEGIPLDFGDNAIVVKLYGPTGEVETIDHSQRVGSRLAVGKLHWQAHTAKPQQQLFDFTDEERDQPDAIVSSFRGELGLTKNLSAGINYARVAEVDEQQTTHTGDFFGITMSPMLGDQAINLQYSVQDSGRQAYSARSSMPIGPLSVGLGYEYYDEGFGGVQDEIGDRIEQRYSARTAVPLTFLGLKNQRVSLAYDESRYFGGRRVVRNQLGFGHRLFGLQMSHTADLVARYGSAGSTAARTGDYRLLTSYSRNLMSLRGEVNYSLQPDVQFRNASVSGTYRINDWQTATVGASFARGGNTAFYASYAQQFDSFNISVSASHSADSWGVGLNIATSFGYVPGYGIRMQPTLNLERGMALVTATEQFGSQPATPLAGLQMMVNQRRHENSSNDDGYLVVDELDILYPAQLTVNKSSLPDPFLVPVIPKVEIWPRPGQSIRLPIELVESSLVSGVAYIDFGDQRQAPLRRMFVELLDEQGRVHAETLTMDDGFFEFDSAYPGQWSVRMKPEQSQLRTPVTTDARAFEIAEGAFAANDIDLSFLVASEAELTVIEPREEPPELTVLFTFDSADVVPEYQAKLATIADYLARYDGVIAIVHGHTDSSGGEAYNMELSRRRAYAVRDVLVNGYGVSSERVEVLYSGKEQAVADGDSDTADSLSRRVVISIESVYSFEEAMRAIGAKRDEK